MHLVVFLLLILGCWCDIQVLIDQNGGYNFTVNNQVWLRSSRTAIYADDRWYSTEDKSLSLVGITTAQGTDPNLGSWNETKFMYNLVRSGKTTSVISHIRQWSTISAFTFHLETGATALTTNIGLSNDTVRTVFPSFLIEKMNMNDDRGYITVGGLMAGDADKHAGRWNSTRQIIRSGILEAPVILFNLSQQGDGDTIVFSPFSHFLTTSLSQRYETPYSALEYGVTGSVSTIPANYVQSFIIFYSAYGINKGVRQWGQTMQRAFNRTQEHRINDMSLNYIGYYMDNGAYYFHNTMPGTNYEDTMINIKNEIKVPIHYMEISAYFYYKGVAGGCSDWSPRPEVFPHGIPALYRRLGNMPFIIHNRYWAYDAVYQKNYSWILDAETGLSLPASNDTFWLDLLTKARNWGVILYQQDWLSETYAHLHQSYTNINLLDQWLTSMGAAAEQVEINLHYIMSYPRHVLKALEIPRVTQVRTSGDYAFNLVDPNAPTWNMGITSMIADALGLAPNKDVLWSTSTQEGNPYGENAREPIPDRAILIATLSTGPVGIGDAVNLINVERIMRCCRQDGLILKPDRAITTINALAADWARYDNVPQGELYSTETTIDNQTFHIVFASAMKRDYIISPSMIDSEPGMVWFYDNRTNISPFDGIYSLYVSADRCNNSSICVWYISPLWQFNDAAKTKYALLGEWNKWTAISRQRFLSIRKNTENTETTIIVQGATSEVVQVIVYHSTLQSVTVNCSISEENGQASLVITPTNVICT